MLDPTDTEQLDERLESLRSYAYDIGGLEARASALKELRDVVIAGLSNSGVPTRTIADAAGISHVRVAAIANDALQRGIEEGWVDPASRTSLGDSVRHETSRSIAPVLEEDRGS